MKEWATLAVSLTISRLVAWVALDWFVPGLLCRPAEARIFRASERIAPFYDAVFRAEDRAEQRVMLEDPVKIVRSKPFLRAPASQRPHGCPGLS